MAANADKRRNGGAKDWPWRGDSAVTLASINRTMRAGFPLLGQSFIEGKKGGHQDEGDLTVRTYLVGKLGSRGYGRQLQRMNEAAQPVKSKRRRRRRKAVAA